jgi:hypothetical protein
MNEEDYKKLISTYQQKSFELFHQNIINEIKLSELNKRVTELSAQLSEVSQKNTELMDKLANATAKSSRTSGAKTSG